MASTAVDEREDVAPDDIPKPGWKAILKRTGKEFQNDNLTDWAAALTYYAVLALFPAMIVLVALLGLFGQYPQTTNELLDILRQVGVTADARDAIKASIDDVVQSKGGAGALLGFGLLAALWSASGYIGALMRATDQIYEKDEGRPFWKLRPLQVAVTLAMVIALTLVAVGLVVTGPLAEAIGNVIGLGSTTVALWNVAKWPVMLVLVMTMVATLYYVAPNVKQPRFRIVSAGGAAAVVIWIAASAGFALYVAHFGSYNKTYGSLAGVIIFLMWMW